MKVANIVSTSKISVSGEFNVVKSLGDITQGLPTLIIGFDLADKLYPNFDITNPKLDDNIYWCFKRTENRDKFDESLETFKTQVYENLIKSVNYVFVDPIQYPLKTIRKILNKINSLKYKITYVHEHMIYLYGENLIFGIDLKLLKYMSMNVDKIKVKIRRISNVFLDDNKILIEYKKNVGKLGDQVRYIPFLYSISNEQNDTSSLIYISRES